jgi:Fe-S cluster assembly iron-binding protein IscA
MVTFTDNAIEKFREFLAQEKANGIRIFLTEGGWSPSLAMDIANGPEDDDATIEKSGVKVFLSREADIFLSNANFDYSDIRGFMIAGMPESSCCG